MHVSFLDKACNEYVRITSDVALFEAFSQYWDIRRLPLQVIFHDLEPLEEVLPSTNLETALVVACVEPPSAPSDKELHCMMGRHGWYVIRNHLSKHTCTY